MIEITQLKTMHLRSSRPVGQQVVNLPKASCSSMARMALRQPRNIAHCTIIYSRKCSVVPRIACRAEPDREEELRAATEEYAELNDAIEVRH
jgi:hypothetical protein